VASERQFRISLLVLVAAQQMRKEVFFLNSFSRLSSSDKARLLLVLLTFAWGLSWPTMKIALDEVGLWALRIFGLSISTVSLFFWMKFRGISLAIPRGTRFVHIFIASFFNIIGFSFFASLAQLYATTSRVVIINYSMPIWGSLLAWLILGERLNRMSAIGLALCVAGIGILVYPVVVSDSAVGLLLAHGCMLCWAFGTIYMKWARIPGDKVAITAWQIAIGAVVMIVSYFVYNGPSLPVFTPVSWQAALAVLYNGLIGTGLAYLLWFAILDRLPTATASLGTLANPVIGIIFSVILLGERPTMADIVGFALIFTAAVCVLVPQGERASPIVTGEPAAEKSETAR
jgi:drug/metabolite transporter (DMT)-like permease